jgi:IS30 family transposase
MQSPTNGQRKAGRPRALDKIKRHEICALVSMGSSLEGAARYVGCAPSTIRREAARNPGFNDALRRSSFSAEIVPLQAMRGFAKKHWPAAAWLLERIDPQRFGKQNVRYLKPEDISHFLQIVGDLIKDEVRDPDATQRVLGKLAEVSKAARREAWADRDTVPRSRRRNRVRFEYPPDHPSAIARKASDSKPTPDAQPLTTND